MGIVLKHHNYLGNAEYQKRLDLFASECVHQKDYHWKRPALIWARDERVHGAVFGLDVDVFFNHC